MWRKIGSLLRRFARDTRGVSAVEFALILPVQIALLFGTVEIANVLIADRKTAIVASATADLVAQVQAVNDADMGNIFNAADAMMQPFDPAFISIVIISVVADNGGITSVAWSDARNATAYAPGASYTLPPGIVGPNESVIVCEVQYSYQSDFGDLLAGTVMLTDKFYLAPRRSVSVARTAI